MKIYVINWTKVFYNDESGNNFFDDRFNYSVNNSGNLEKVFTDLKKAQEVAEQVLEGFADNLISELKINKPKKYRYDRTFPNGLNDYTISVSGKNEYDEEWEYFDITMRIEELELEE